VQECGTFEKVEIRMVGYSSGGETLIVRSSEWIRDFKKEEKQQLNDSHAARIARSGRYVEASYDWSTTG
jgi:hypothetical protein